MPCISLIYFSREIAIARHELSRLSVKFVAAGRTNVGKTRFRAELERYGEIRSVRETRQFAGLNGRAKSGKFLVGDFALRKRRRATRQTGDFAQRGIMQSSDRRHTGNFLVPRDTRDAAVYELLPRGSLILDPHETDAGRRRVGEKKRERERCA